MLCYRDMTFCEATERCATLDCARRWTPDQSAHAERWWGGPGAPVAFSDFSATCPLFTAAQGEESEDHPAQDCERCAGNGEIVTDWPTYLHPPEGADADAGTADCPDCGGIGKVAAAPAGESAVYPAGWRSIETAPRDGKPFLTFTPDDTFSAITGIEVMWFDSQLGLVYGPDCTEPVFKPTHWMPLPAAPTGRSQ